VFFEEADFDGSQKKVMFVRRRKFPSAVCRFRRKMGVCVCPKPTMMFGVEG
jgi:hypothetical protein